MQANRKAQPLATDVAAKRTSTQKSCGEISSRATLDDRPCAFKPWTVRVYVYGSLFRTMHFYHRSDAVSYRAFMTRNLPAAARCEMFWDG